MSPEERELLERCVALVEDNNNILHSIKRSMWWSRVMSVIYWVIIIGASLGAYYFIQPYLTKMIDLYNSVSNTEQKLTGSSNNNIQDLLKKFQGN